MQRTLRDDEQRKGQGARHPLTAPRFNLIGVLRPKWHIPLRSALGNNRSLAVTEYRRRDEKTI
jgi:hypothetical protein